MPVRDKVRALKTSEKQMEERWNKSTTVGIREGKSSCDKMFIRRNVIKQCTKWQRQLITNFIDFENALTLFAEKGHGSS